MANYKFRKRQKQIDDKQVAMDVAANKDKKATDSLEQEVEDLQKQFSQEKDRRRRAEKETDEAKKKVEKFKVSFPDTKKVEKLKQEEARKKAEAAKNADSNQQINDDSKSDDSLVSEDPNESVSKDHTFGREAKTSIHSSAA